MEDKMTAGAFGRTMKYECDDPSNRYPTRTPNHSATLCVSCCTIWTSKYHSKGRLLKDSSYKGHLVAHFWVVSSRSLLPSETHCDHYCSGCWNPIAEKKKLPFVFHLGQNSFRKDPKLDPEPENGFCIPCLGSWSERRYYPYSPYLCK